LKTLRADLSILTVEEEVDSTETGTITEVSDAMINRAIGPNTEALVSQKELRTAAVDSNASAIDLH
jgi:hypothetical protein